MVKILLPWEGRDLLIRAANAEVKNRMGLIENAITECKTRWPGAFRSEGDPIVFI